MPELNRHRSRSPQTSTARRLARPLRPIVARLFGLSPRRWPARGFVRFGSLRRLAPVSRNFGLDRGTPIDRYYIDDFLRRHAGRRDYVIGDVQGHVLEIGMDTYTRRFGR